MAKTDPLFFHAALAGTLGLTCILFFETFILKAIALNHAVLVDPGSELYLYPPFRTVVITSGILFSIGYMGIAIKLMKQTAINRWLLSGLLIGAPLFGNVFIPGNIRLAGMLIFCLSLLTIGLKLIRENRLSRH